jgi:hypothetical protein
MFDIIDKFNVLQLCFNQGSNIVNQPNSSIGAQCVDSSLRLEDGSPMQSHFTRVQPHDGAMTKAHDNNIALF